MMYLPVLTLLEDLPFHFFAVTVLTHIPDLVVTRPDMLSQLGHCLLVRIAHVVEIWNYFG